MQIRYIKPAKQFPAKELAYFNEVKIVFVWDTLFLVNRSKIPEEMRLE